MSSTKKAKYDKAGQPTKYKPEYCQMLIEHMRGLNSFESFGDVVDVCTDTLYEWCKQNSEFSDAKKKGRLSMRRGLENVGKGLMTGKIKGNVAAWIFYSKNTIGWGDDPVSQFDDEDEWKFE
jgi:hypothetical protein